MAKLCKTKDVGLNGNLFGGTMLAWMDEETYIFAKQKILNEYLVTYKYGEITFLKPIKVGDIVCFDFNIIEFRSSSISIDIIARVNTETIFKTNCVLITVDEDGLKTPIRKI